MAVYTYNNNSEFANLLFLYAVINSIPAIATIMLHPANIYVTIVTTSFVYLSSMIVEPSEGIVSPQIYSLLFPLSKLKPE